mgnify:CR=1 FL=1
MKRLIPILLAVFAFAACEKDPDMDKLDNDYLVYTNYDKKANFKEFTTYYLPDKILVISDKEEPEYLEGEAAQEILAAYKSNMDQRGYTMAASKEEAQFGKLHQKHLFLHRLRTTGMVVGLSRILGLRLLGQLGWRMVLSIRSEL